MCYALKQISYWYIYDFLVDILFFPFCNYFMCISFFVDWYHFIYLESYTLERCYIFSGYPYSFTSTFPWCLCEMIYLECRSFVASWCTLLRWRYCFSLACLDEAFAISIGIPPLDKAIIFFLHHGLSQVLVIHFAYLVCLWTHLLGVCGKDMSCTLYLHYSRLCWCLMLIRILVFSSALPWLTHIDFGWAYS